MGPIRRSALCGTHALSLHHAWTQVAAFETVVLPLARAYAPSLLIVSAGFDSAEGDPQGDMRISPGGFGRLASLLLEELKLPTVFALEGGYVRRCRGRRPSLRTDRDSARWPWRAPRASDSPALAMTEPRTAHLDDPQISVAPPQRALRCSPLRCVWRGAAPTWMASAMLTRPSALRRTPATEPKQNAPVTAACCEEVVRAALGEYANRAPPPPQRLSACLAPTLRAVIAAHAPHWPQLTFGGGGDGGGDGDDSEGGGAAGGEGEGDAGKGGGNSDGGGGGGGGGGGVAAAWERRLAAYLEEAAENCVPPRVSKRQREKAAVKEHRRRESRKLATWAAGDQSD